MLNSYFDRIVCVNLDKRTDRWERCTELFNSIGVHVDRISAIEDSEKPWNGLRLTTIKIFENAMEDHVGRLLILEDDIEWSENFPTQFIEIYEQLPLNWDMFYFSAAHQFWPDVISEKLFKLKWSTAAHAVGFHHRCFSRIYDALSSREEAIDVIYSSLQTEMNAYCSIDPIAWQRKGYSDIEKQEKWYPYLKDVRFYEEYLKKTVTVDGKDTVTGEQIF